MPPPPLALFRKFIRLCSRTLPLVPLAMFCLVPEDYILANVTPLNITPQKKMAASNLLKRSMRGLSVQGNKL